MATVYSDILLEHHRNPKNFGSMKKPTSSASVNNPLCGDTIKIDILTQNAKVVDIAFSGEGCVISQASASLLTDYVKGKKVADLLKLNSEFMNDLVGIEVSLSRLKCLLLSLEALKEALL